MKKSHRIARDVSLVIAFCVGFLGLIWLANFLQNDSDEQTSSEFSEYRLGADQATRGQDLDVSLKNLRALVKNDPFDGRAQHELASTLFSQIIAEQESIEKTNRIEPSISNDQQQQANSSDQTKPVSPTALETYPNYNEVTVPADVYGTDEDGVVLGVNNILIVDAGMDEELAFQITQAIYDHMDEFQEENAIARQIDPAQSLELKVPLHPGAARYFNQ